MFTAFVRVEGKWRSFLVVAGDFGMDPWGSVEEGGGGGLPSVRTGL